MLPVAWVATLATVGTRSWATSRADVGQAKSATGPGGEHLLYEIFIQMASMDVETVAWKV